MAGRRRGWLPSWPLRAWGWVWGIRVGGEDLKLSVTSATLPAASLWIHTYRKETCNSDSCSSQNLFFIKMLCAAGYGGVKLICLWECVCLERTIRYFVFFKIILRDGLYKVSLFLPYIAACRNGARRDHLPCWEWPWCTTEWWFSHCLDPKQCAKAVANKPVWFWRRHLWRCGVIHQDKDTAAASPFPVTDAIRSFTVAFLLDKRFYRDHLFIKKTVPIIASLHPPLIIPHVFHTVFKLISIWKIKYIHLVILGHLMISKGIRRKKRSWQQILESACFFTGCVNEVWCFSEHVKASRSTYYAGTSASFCHK